MGFIIGCDVRSLRDMGQETVVKTTRNAWEDGTAGTSGHSRGAEAWLAYDGDCPFCNRYVKYMRLRDSVGPLDLVNARDGGPRVEEILRAGLDLDEGMVLKLGDRYYHGADCIHALALLSGEADWFNRINAVIFRSPRLSGALYPVLRAGRNTVLWMLGRSRISSPGISGDESSGAPSPVQDSDDTR